jgi:integrase
MSADRSFAGPWAHLFEEFVTFKRSLGYLLPEDAVRKYRLLSQHIASFPTDPRVLTVEMVDAFLDPADRAPGTVWQRRNTVKQFALFLRGRGIDCWQPPDRFDAIPAPRFDPRIITSQEMAKVIAVADAMPPSPPSPFGAAIYGMLLRMLWCCGLRIGEALRLSVGDVDLDSPNTPAGMSSSSGPAPMTLRRSSTRTREAGTTRPAACCAESRHACSRPGSPPTGSAHRDCTTSATRSRSPP